MYNILSKPGAGWSHFTFDEDARISYIDDFPHFLLKEATEAMNENRSFCATFDAEGYEYSILSYDLYDVELIVRKDEQPTIKKLNINFATFISGIIDDVRSDIEAWACFPASYSLEEDRTEEETKELVDELNKLIDETEQTFTRYFKNDIDLDR